MIKIIRTIGFILVLAGLLAWGAVTMAKAPSPLVDSSQSREITVLQGTQLDPSTRGHEADRNQFQRTN